MQTAVYAKVANPFLRERIVRAFIFALTLTALCAMPLLKADAATLPTSGTFDEVTTITANHLTVKMVKSVTFKGANYRMDSTMLDLTPYSRIMDNNTMYSYLPNQQTAMRKVSTEKEVGLPEQLWAQKNAFLQGATKGGLDTVSGFPCDIYSKPQSSSDVSFRVWISRDPRFPFVVKTETIDHKQGVTQIQVVENIKLNTPVSDSVFALPKSTKLVDAPADDQGAGAGTGTASAGSAPTSPASPSTH